MSEEPNSTVKGESASHAKKRVLDVFLIDSGWNTDVGEAVRSNISSFASYLRGNRFFVLSKEQSVDFVNLHPSLVGADPILLVLDRNGVANKSEKAFGFRLCLGHIRSPQAAVSMLQWAVQLTRASSSEEMSQLVKESGQRQTVQGTIELIGESSTHLLEFAPV